jgi:colanic acid/amylovoran biosynthesis glycosyltransferase
MGKLLIIPVLEVTIDKSGTLFLTKKFIDGIMLYKRYWDGKIKVLMRASNQSSTNLDNIEIDLDKLPFELILIGSDISPDDLTNASIVLVSVSYKNNTISKLCLELGIPCVYISEYSFKTGLQIIKSSRVNFVIKLRRVLWLINQERKQRKAIRQATGIQCNGAPTFEVYSKINKNPIIYFDNRITGSQFISSDNLNNRLAYLEKGNPLRLAFSGRLIEMKGADHLIKVAQELKGLNIPFTMSIFGGGSLEKEMKESILANGLDGFVKMEGILDFESELLPRIQDSVDLFVCCHRQGDPSCTYIETLACGVPIVGYCNEAFDGILKLVEVGYSVSMDNYKKLAILIGTLSKDRNTIKKLAYNSLTFAKDHSVENIFYKRIEHLKSLV